MHTYTLLEPPLLWSHACGPSHILDTYTFGSLLILTFARVPFYEQLLAACSELPVTLILGSEHRVCSLLGEAGLKDLVHKLLLNTDLTPYTLCFKLFLKFQCFSSKLFEILDLTFNNEL